MTIGKLQLLAVSVATLEVVFLSVGSFVTRNAVSFSKQHSTLIAVLAGVVVFIGIPMGTAMVVGLHDRGVSARLALAGSAGVIAGSILWIVLGRLLGVAAHDSSMVVGLWRTLGYGATVGLSTLGVGSLFLGAN